MLGSRVSWIIARDFVCMPNMTTSWLRKLLLVVAILVMPVQGVAIAATFVQCHEQAAAQAVTHDAGAAQHDHSAGHSHDPSDDGTTGSVAGHHLCGHCVLYVPTSVTFAFQPRFAAWSASAASSYQPHFPEHPRRPPRA